MADPTAPVDGAPAPNAAVVVVTPPAAQAGTAKPSEHRPLRRFRARWLALVAVTALAIYLCWLMLEPFVVVLLWAMVLAIIFYPAHTRIVRRTQNPGLAAALSCLLVIATILIPLAVVTVPVLVQAVDVARYLQDNADQLLDPQARPWRWISPYVDIDRMMSRQGVAEQLRGVGGALARNSLDIIGGFLISVLKVIFVVLTLYYLFRDGERLRNALLDALPLERVQSELIFERTREVIGASVYGVLIVATVQAILGGLAFWAVDLPSALLWTVVMFFLSMIPMAGSFIVWVPACLFLLATGHWGRALGLALWCALVVGMVDNVLRPRLVGQRTRLHELLVFFSVIGGITVFGPLGLIVGPVVVAVTLALLDVFRKAERPVAATLRERTLVEEQAALRNVPTERPPRDAATSDGKESRSNRKRRRGKQQA